MSRKQLGLRRVLFCATLSVIAIAVIGFPTRVSALEFVWDESEDADWTTVNRWIYLYNGNWLYTNRLPGSSDSVSIGADPWTADRWPTITTDVSISSLTIQPYMTVVSKIAELTVANGTFSIANGLVVNGVNQNHRATMIQTGGTVRVGEQTVIGSYGNYVQSSGTLRHNSADAYGDHDILLTGSDSCMYTLDGGAVYGRYLGILGDGAHFYQTGGSVYLSDFGGVFVSGGSYHFPGGALHSPLVEIGGDLGPGFMHVWGGDLDVDTLLIHPNGIFRNGDYGLTSDLDATETYVYGTLQTRVSANLSGVIWVESGGLVDLDMDATGTTGTLLGTLVANPGGTITGSTVAVSGSFYALGGDIDGIENIRVGPGGDFYVFQPWTVTQKVEVAGGTVNLDANVQGVTTTVGSGGELELTNGSLEAGALTVANGGVFDWQDGNVNRLGQLTVQTGGQVNVAPEVDIDFPVTVNGGTLNLDANAQGNIALIVPGGSLTYNSGQLLGYVLGVDQGASFTMSASSLGVAEVDVLGTMSSTGTLSYSGNLVSGTGGLIALQNINLGSGGELVPYGGAVTAQAVTVGSGAFVGSWLTGGSLTASTVTVNNGGEVYWSAGTYSVGTTTINAGGAFTMGGGTIGQTIVLNGGQFTSDVSDLQFGGTLQINNSAALHGQELTLTNGGTFRWNAQYGATVDVDVIRIDPGATLEQNYYWLLSGTTLVVNGTLDAYTGGTSVQMLALGSGGRLEGHGDITAGVSNTSGVIAPGDSATGQDATGTLSVSGLVINAGLGDESYIEIELAGTDVTDYDRIDVRDDPGIYNGRARLNGELRVVLLDSFNPSLGDYFDIISYVERMNSSEFSSLVLPTLDAGLEWVTQYDYPYDPGLGFESLRLSVVAGGGGGGGLALIPEPGSLALFGVFAITLLQRRTIG